MPKQTYRNILNIACSQGIGDPEKILKLFWKEYSHTQEYKDSIQQNSLITHIPSSRRIYNHLLSYIKNQNDNKPSFTIQAFYQPNEFLDMLSVFLSEFIRYLPALKWFGTLTQKITINDIEAVIQHLGIGYLIPRLENSIVEFMLWDDLWNAEILENVSNDLLKLADYFNLNQRKQIIKIFIDLFANDFDMIYSLQQLCALVLSWADEIERDNIVIELTRFVKKRIIKENILVNDDLFAYFLEIWTKEYRFVSPIVQNAMLQTLLDLIGCYEDVPLHVWSTYMFGLVRNIGFLDREKVVLVENTLKTTFTKIENFKNENKKLYLVTIESVLIVLSNEIILANTKSYPSPGNYLPELFKPDSEIIKRVLGSFEQPNFIFELQGISGILYPYTNSDTQNHIFNGLIKLENLHRHEIDNFSFFRNNLIMLFPYLNHAKQKHVIGIFSNEHEHEGFYSLISIFKSNCYWRNYIFNILFEESYQSVESLRSLGELIHFFDDKQLEEFKEHLQKLSLSEERAPKIIEAAKLMQVEFFSKPLSFATDHAEIISLLNEGDLDEIKYALSHLYPTEKLSVYLESKLPIVTNETWPILKIISDQIAQQNLLKEVFDATNLTPEIATEITEFATQSRMSV